jgi:hypothetical protein
MMTVPLSLLMPPASFGSVPPLPLIVQFSRFNMLPARWFRMPAPWMLPLTVLFVRVTDPTRL